MCIRDSKLGDVVLAGIHYGKVKAMFNERNVRIQEAKPGEPVLILGLNGAPQAGDNFNVMATEHEAREISNKREQLQREQSIRTKKHFTLDELGRRIALGDFKELNIIVKGDVDGSVEALAAVSYTHLDVYKRQFQYCGAGSDNFTELTKFRVSFISM